MSKIQHTFLTKAHDIQGLFKGVTKLSGFVKNLASQASKDPIRYSEEKYLGDGFEFFIELLLALHPCDNRLGVYDYTPNEINDNGVDGTAINNRLEKCVVQIKFRTNKIQQLTANADHLSNLISDGMGAFGVIYDQENSKNYRHFVFTTAAGLHFYTDQEMYKGHVKCFGYKELRSLVDNNLIFWDKAQKLIQYSLNTK